MKILRFLLLGLLVSVNCLVVHAEETVSIEEQIRTLPLRNKISRMFMVGLQGKDLTEDNPIISRIQDYRVGGIILMSGNIAADSLHARSAERLQALCTQLRSYADYPLLISVDQEGGNVMRLRPAKGYPNIPSHEYLGKCNREDTTRYYAALTAQLLDSVGIQLNFAPCTDVNVNPECPVIAGLNRSFSAHPARVVRHATYFIDEHRKHQVLTAIKHFPGHGNSKADSHKGLTDISDTWKRKELRPYKHLIKRGYCDMVMVGHIFNNQIDSVYPASLSYATITGLLRGQLGWQGVVVTDDLCMRAITDYYSLEETLLLSIQAGADILLFSNSRLGQLENAIQAVEQLVRDERISEARINESFRRIVSLTLEREHNR